MSVQQLLLSNVQLERFILLTTTALTINMIALGSLITEGRYRISHKQVLPTFFVKFETIVCAILLTFLQTHARVGLLMLTMHWNQPPIISLIMGSSNSHSRVYHVICVMDDLLKYETQVQTVLQEGNPPGVLPFPNGLESESPEAELWSRVHLSYVTSLNLGGYNTAAAIAQWADIRSGLLIEYVPKKTWSFSQAELKGLEQKLTLRIQSCRYCDELDFQLSHGNEVVTPLTLFCRALLYCVCKDKELFDEKLLPNEVTWQGFVHNTYSPIWRAEIEFFCTKVTNENLLPMGLHVLSAVIVMHKLFVKLSTNQVTAQKDCLSWLYEPQQLRTISSCCEDTLSSYFDDTYKSHLCEDLDQTLSIEKLSSITQQGFHLNYVFVCIALCSALFMQ